MSSVHLTHTCAYTQCLVNANHCHHLFPGKATPCFLCRTGNPCLGKGSPQWCSRGFPFKPLASFPFSFWLCPFLLIRKPPEWN